MFNLHSSKIGIIHSLTFCKFLFVVMWIFGLLVGYGISVIVSSAIQFQIRGIVTANTAIVGIVFSFLVSLLFTAFFFYHKLPTFILPVVFLKAACFSFCSCAITASLGDAGWLLSGLYTFSDACSVILLLWFWLRCMTGEALRIMKYSILSIVAMCLICYFDYAFISPFVEMLL